MPSRTGIRRMARGLLAVAAGMAATGCYTYVPVTTPTPGATVRLHVPVHTSAVARNLAPSSVEVEGTLLSAGDTLVLETESTREAGTFRQVMLMDTMRVSRGDLDGVDLRTLSKGRTVVFGLAVAAATAGVAIGIANAVSGSQGGQDGGGKPNGAVIASFPFALSRILRLVGG
jgi:hypothetical protein